MPTARTPRVVFATVTYRYAMYAHAGWSVPCGELPAGLPRTRGPEAEALLTRAFLADLRRAAYTDRGGRRRRTTHCEAGDRLLKLLLECGAVGVQGRRDHADPLLVAAAARNRGDAVAGEEETRSAVLNHRPGSWPAETAFRLVQLRGLPAGWLRDFGTARRCSTTRAPSSRRCPSGRRCRSPATTPNGYGTSNAFSTGAQQVRYKKPDAIFFAGRGADLRGFVIANVGSALHRAGPSPTSQQALREARDPPTSASSTSTTSPSVARVTPSPRTARRLSATTRCGPWASPSTRRPTTTATPPSTPRSDRPRRAATPSNRYSCPNPARTPFPQVTRGTANGFHMSAAVM